MARAINASRALESVKCIADARFLGSAIGGSNDRSRPDAATRQRLLWENRLTSFCDRFRRHHGLCVGLNFDVGKWKSRGVFWE